MGPVVFAGEPASLTPSVQPVPDPDTRETCPISKQRAAMLDHSHSHAGLVAAYCTTAYFFRLIYTNNGSICCSVSQQNVLFETDVEAKFLINISLKVLFGFLRKPA